MVKNSQKSLSIISILLFTVVISSFGFVLEKKFKADKLISEKDVNFTGNSQKDLVVDNRTNASSDFLNFDYINPQDSTDSLDAVLSKDSLDLSGIVDTINVDSMAIDSMAVDSMAIDSTARLKYFRYQRNDKPYTQFRPDRKSSFFAQPSGNYYQRNVKLDSTGQYVIITEVIAGEEIKPGLKIPLDVYIDLKLKAMSRDEWEALGYKYELKDGEKNLEDLLTDITNIDIPLPKTSFLSIFGPNRIQLRINGAVDIHGAWRSETTEGLTVSRLGNTRNEPDFKQQVQINVSGTIGDKLEIGADWSTERTFEYENQLKLKYTGYEDEIVQSVEAGNVSLQTSSLVGGSEALFGIKSEFQLGPFRLTALASQKKGEIQEKSITGGSTTNQFEIRAYQYSENHFFLHKDYANPEIGIFNSYFGETTPVTFPEYEVLDIEVWKSTEGLIEKGSERKATAYIDLDPINEGENYPDNLRNADSKVGQVVNGRFRKLEEGVDYILHPYTGFISLKSNVQDNEAIAVAYQIRGTGIGENVYGEFLRDVPSDTSVTLVLKLVKPPNLKPGGQFQDAWDLMLKNIYPIGGRDVKKEGFTLDITYTAAGQEPRNDYDNVKLLQAFGLDETDETGTGGPDGAFDFLNTTIMTETGEIIFPVLQPFGRDFPEALPEDLKFQKIYDTLKTFAQQEKELDRFVIAGEYSASTTAVHSIGFNVVENSVKVYLNGQELTPGVDYAVDYNIGQITIRNDNALIPGADLRITYEQNDLFQLASKSLLGFRGLYDFNERTKLGFSILNLNQKTLSDKVRIGEEPISNSIYGVDFQTGFDLPFITSGLDYLISTREQSTVNLKAEFAYINPDPNTKKSPIGGDNNKSIAYVDDFEGAKRIIPITIAYQAWNDLSAPENLPAFGGRELSKIEMMDYKAKSYWFNFLPYSGVKVEDIWPEKQAAREEENVQVLELVYDPTKKGTYNWTPNLDTLSLNWGGMMKRLSSTANNLVAENIEFIEFWLQVGEGTPEDAKFYIDLGKISENVIPTPVPPQRRSAFIDDKLHTEDFNGNDLVDEGEDVGIDMLIDADEPGYDPNTNPDPSGDNIQIVQGSFNIEDYAQVNGTEGNSALMSGNIPDTEDLIRNQTLDDIRSFFRYEVSIDTVKDSNPLIVGGGGNNSGWYQFRIPLREYQDAIGDPSLTDVDMIRIFFNGVESPVHLRFVDFNLVGNQWQKVLVPNKVTEDDETLTISTISVEENPDYNPPSDNLRERDRTKPDQEVFKNEQSLKLSINNLQDGDNRKIIKYLYRPLDIFNYKELKLFLHGDLMDLPGSVSYYDNPDIYGSEVFIRFGSDTSNFYEYRMPLQAGWQDMHIIFSELTAIKQTRPDEKVLFQVPVDGKEGHTYGVQGNPSLTRVNFFMIGIKNPSDRRGGQGGGDGETIISGDPVSGDIWVNEMRVLSAEDQDGWAYAVSGSANFADLLTVNANMSQTNPYFHRLSDRFGNRIDAKNWGVSVNLDILKLMPFSMEGSNLKLNYSRTESINKPLFKPGTDIKVDEAAEQLQEQLIDQGYSEENAANEAQLLRTEAQTVNISDTWALSGVKFTIPTDKWYIRETFNRLTFAFNYNKSMGRNPTQKTIERWVWNASARYNVNFSNQNFFHPADIPLFGNLFKIFNDYEDVKIYFTPQSFNSTVSANRRRSFSQSRDLDVEPNIQRDFTTSRDAGFNWKLTEGGFFNLSTNYNVTVSSSLTHLLTAAGMERSEQAIWNDVLTRSFFGNIYDYRQSFDLRSAPQLPSLWSINKFFTVNASYGVTYNWRNNFTQEQIGRSAGYSNRITADMNLRLKSLFAPLFASDPQSQQKKTPAAGRGRGSRTRDTQTGDDDKDEDKLPEARTPSDSTLVDQEDEETGPRGLTKGFMLLKNSVKYLLLDYDQISIRFSQNNSLSGSGLKGESTGFGNFWGINQNSEMGPTRLFMLGFTNDLGPRVAIPQTNLSDNYSQKNDLSFSTSRPLWENAQIDLDWKVGWGLNKSISYNVNEFGELIQQTPRSTGTLERSFLALPSFLFISGGVTEVAALYDANSDNPKESLSNAFVKGFETFPLLAKIPFLSDLANYIPRPNWRINWSGLEKISFFKGFAKRVTFSHAYSSSYNEGWRLTTNGEEEIQSQRIESGFAPLVGLNITFNEIWDGNLTGSIKYNTRNSFNLGASTQNITEQFSRDINVSASFSKAGFSLPFFGLSLKNDIEMSLSYTSGKNSTILYEMNNFNEEGEPQDGTTRTVIEPRVRYVMSSRVTLSIFYKRTSISPEGAARIPPSTTNEAGVDVRIAIQ